MKYLLDTHTLLWFYEGSPQLPQSVKSIILNKNHQIVVSAASVWELAIKLSLNKLEISMPIEDLVELAQLDNIVFLPILTAHTVAVQNLPYHHKDPFDRLIATICSVEGFVLLSADKIYDQYGTHRLW